jgi:hypothetical protein
MAQLSTTLRFRHPPRGFTAQSACMDSVVASVANRQDGLLTRQQALIDLSQAEITARLGKRWQVILPGIYATFTGPLSARHRLRAALLHGGPRALVNDLTALRAYGLPFLAKDDALFRIVVPASVQRSSREFVVVRRTTRVPRPVQVNGLPTVPLIRALCEFGARRPNEREAFAVIAAAIQERRTDIDRLTAEIEQSPNRGRPKLIRIAGELREGVRSVAESDFKSLLSRSKSLPAPLWNCLLRLPDGELISPDALFADAALIHETNGRRYHAAEDKFDNMQVRNDALVTAGFAVLHNPPRRIIDNGPTVLTQIEECFRQRDGLGLPRGVTIVRLGPPGTM